MEQYRTTIVGGGASGCFCAVEMKRRHPDWDVCVIEAAVRPMLKLAVTGGGRCNLTNSFAAVDNLGEVYPRGEQLMRRAMRVFDQNACMEWWEREGVALVVQEDGCVFPRSQDAMQLVNTLERLMKSFGVRLICGCKVMSIKYLPEAERRFELEFRQHPDRHGTMSADRVVVSAGGNSRAVLERMLPPGTAVTDTVPSLFTLKIGEPALRALSGTVVQDATLIYNAPSSERSAGKSTMRSRGILLLTDWGVSGPTTLRLSSYAARALARSQYKGSLTINWLSCNENEIRTMLGGMNGRKYLANCHPEGLSDRLWRYLVARAGLREDIRCCEVGGKGLSRLVSVLSADCYAVEGRARFKEEFVTCGGVDLKSININTLESKQYPGLFFVGEVLDLDAVTGGYNLQAAWSTAYIAAD